MTDPLQVLGTTVAGKYDVVEFMFQRGARLAFRGLHRAWGEPVFVEFAALDRSVDPQALDVQRRRTCAGIQLGFERSDAQHGQRDPFAPADHLGARRRRIHEALAAGFF